MKKIIVPTDFSVNSKAGIRFALRWSTVEKLELIFVHAIHTSRPLQWTDEHFFNYVEKESAVNKNRLKDFMESVFDRARITPEKYQYVILDGISPDLSIIQYCNKRNDIDFICMSTAGTGGLKKLLGTNTGNLITKSKVPVIAVPISYRSAPIKKLMYAADFRHCDAELKKVIDFAGSLKATLKVVHFNWPGEILPDKDIIASGIKKIFKFPLVVCLKEPDLRYSLIENLEKYIEQTNPSLAIMFTNQDRSLFQKIFLPSNAEQLSFRLRTPLLVFNKEYSTQFLTKR